LVKRNFRDGSQQLGSVLLEIAAGRHADVAANGQAKLGGPEMNAIEQFRFDVKLDAAAGR